MTETDALQAAFLRVFDELEEECIIDSLLDSDENVPIPSCEFSHREVVLLEEVRAAYLVVRKSYATDDVIDLLFEALCSKSRTRTLAINPDDPTAYRTVWHTRRTNAAQ